MEKEEKKHICICGKIFQTAQKLGSHKSLCKEYYLNRDGHLDNYEKRIITLSNSNKAYFEKIRPQLELEKIEQQTKFLNQWISEKNICEKCGKVMTEYYGSGRFCSSKCAKSFSTSKNREEINKKVGAKLKGRPQRLSEKRLLSQENRKRNNKVKRSQKLVKIKGGTLDITYGQLDAYRETHTTCEICGNVETKRNPNTGKPKLLCVDHDHITNRFRGILCGRCNSNLGWYENYTEKIKGYLEKDIIFDK